MKNLKLLLSVILSVNISLFACAQINFPDAEGWKKSKTVTYSSETLWEYIDGAADYYLNYGFEKLDVVEYERAENEYIKLEIYQHSSELSTFGIYAFERPDETDFLEIGAEGYLEHSALNFYIHNWYVKIYTHQKDNEAISTLKTLAKKVAQLPGSGYSLPYQFEYLPLENRLPHSEKYFPANYLGLSFLGNVISANYKEEKSSYTVFLSEQKNQEDAIQILNSYLDFVKSNEEAKAEHLYTLEDMFNGTVYLNVVNNVLIGVLNLEDSSKTERIFNTVNPNLTD